MYAGLKEHDLNLLVDYSLPFLVKTGFTLFIFCGIFLALDKNSDC